MSAVQRLCRLVAALALLGAVAGAGGDPGSASGAVPARDLDVRAIAATGANHAGVIVDKGDGSAPKRICIRFDAASISGEEALRLAAAQDASLAPVFADFGGMGKAVCSLCGIGGSGSDCFSDPTRFWAYHQAAPGGSFRQSPVGVTRTSVTAGSVEGYRYGSGAAPALVDIQTICGEVLAAPPATAAPTTAAPTTAAPPAPAPITTPPAPAPSRAAPGAPAPAPGAGSPADGAAPAPAPDGTTPAPPAADPAGDDPGADGASEATEATEGTQGTEPDAPTEAAGAQEAGGEGGDGDQVAAVRPAGDDDAGGSPVALAGVGALAAAMAAAAVLLRRARATGEVEGS